MLKRSKREMWLALVLVAVFVSLICRLFPSVLDPVVWRSPNPLPVLEESNDLLASSLRIHGDFAGPESLAVDPRTGIVYTGFNDGSVGSFSSDGKFLERVLFLANHTSTAEDASGLLQWCKEEALAKRLAWDVEGERKCGRPLGLRVVADQLYLIDAYHGLFRFHLKTRKIEHLVTPQSLIEKIDGGDASAFLPPRFYNDLDVLPDGRIVFTCSSHRHSRSENRKEVLDGAGRGRLFVFHPQTGQLKVRLCGLHFANGVQALSQDEVLVAELTRFRILRVSLANNAHYRDALQSCEEDGSLHLALQKVFSSSGVEVWADSVPGLVDNIRLTPDGKLLLAGLGSKSAKPFSILHFAFQSFFLRDLIGRFVPMRLVERLLPKYGLVVAYDLRGKVAASLHDIEGKKTAFISQATLHPLTGDLWIGSHSEPFLAILKKKNLPNALQSSV